MTLNTEQSSLIQQMCVLFELLDRLWDSNFKRYTVTQVSHAVTVTVTAAAAAAADDDDDDSGGGGDGDDDDDDDDDDGYYIVHL